MKKLILATVAIFALVGCGGGGGGTSLPSGSLDKTFATNGVKTDGGVNEDVIFDLKCKDDNSILVAGVTEITSSNIDGVLAKYKDIGEKDSSFANNGKVLSGLAGRDFVNKMVIDSSGNTYLVGYITDTSNHRRAIVAKYNSNGQIDTTYGNNGSFITGSVGYDVEGTSIALDSNGKIVVGAVLKHTSAHWTIRVARLNLIGTPDTTFGTNGMVEFGGSSHNVVNDIAIDSVGNILVAGWTKNSDKDLALARITPSGNLDTSFGTNGVKILDSGNGNDEGKAVKIDSTGHIIVAGQSGSHMSLAKFNSNGSLDTNFGNNGVVTYNSSNTESSAFDLTIDSNSDILVTGVSGEGNPLKLFMLIWKYDITGNAVISFGNNGLAKFDTGEHKNYGFSIDIDENNKIVVGGASMQSPNDLQATIWRVNP